MKKYNKKNRQPRDRKPRQIAMPASQKPDRQKLLVKVQMVKDDVLTISRAEYDELVSNAHLLNAAEDLVKCGSKYTAAAYLRHVFKNSMSDELDDVPGMDTLVTLDRAEYDSLNRVTGLLNALISVSKIRPEYDLSDMLEKLFIADEVEKEETP